MGLGRIQWLGFFLGSSVENELIAKKELLYVMR
jgi:hypothetical protein